MKEQLEWVDTLARVGYSAKAVIYFTIGGLAAAEALNWSSSEPDAQSTLDVLARQPFGWVILALLFLGIVSYVIWRLISAFGPAPGGESGLKALVKRAGYLFSGLAYGALAWTAASQLLGMGGGSGGGSGTQEAASAAMNQPFGEWAVILAGMVTIGVAGLFFYQSFSASYRKKFTVTDGGAIVKKWVDRLARFGIAARGVVFLLVGGFLIFAGWTANAGAAKGSGAVIESLEQQPYGVWLLGVMAVGLAAYGGYCAVRARYGRIE
jgi:hypothetical protein